MVAVLEEMLESQSRCHHRLRRCLNNGLMRMKMRMNLLAVVWNQNRQMSVLLLLIMVVVIASDMCCEWSRLLLSVVVLSWLRCHHL